MKIKIILIGTILISAITLSSVGSTNVNDQKTFTLEEMLTYSMEDELAAKLEYEKIIDKLGGGRPFTNIVEAEKTHIKYLEPLLEKYKVEYPVVSKDEVKLPGSLLEAYEIGVEAEISNIGMYNRFSQEELPEDVEEVFSKLKSASENHLRAFQRNVERDRE